jgi:predicted metalloprotease
MRWREQRQSDNIEDRRGMGGGGGPRRPMALGGGAIILLVAVALLTGQDPLVLLEQVSGPQSSIDGGGGGGQPGPAGAPADELGQFSAAVLGSTEDVWTGVFRSGGRTYEQPTLVLFSGAVDSACGYASAAVGPFYCPADSKVYLDLGFFDELKRQFGAPGDFAQAYVVAHEIGHHVQNQLGIANKVHAAQQRASQEEANALSVRMELQADCLAGVWANQAARTANLIEPGDLEEGLTAASAIGDDQIQRRGQGYVVPESWTHGSSEQRTRWLRRGAQSGDIKDCDTFSANDL